MPIHQTFLNALYVWYVAKLSLQGSTICKWYLNPELPEAVALHDRFNTLPAYKHQIPSYILLFLIDALHV